MSEGRESSEDVVAGICFFRPLFGHSVDDAIAMLSSYHGILEKADGFLTSAVVKSHDESLVVAYAFWKRGTTLHGNIMIPELDMLLEELESCGFVDAILYDICIVGSKIGFPPPLASSHAVTVRELNFSQATDQEKLLESGLAVLKIHFPSAGFLFSSLHKSLDGEKIVEIGVWEDKEAAQAAAAINYWDGLGITLQEFRVCNTVYTTSLTRKASPSQ